MGKALTGELSCPGDISPCHRFKKGSFQLLVQVWALRIGKLLRRYKPAQDGVVRVTDCPDMTIAVYCAHKAITTTTIFSPVKNKSVRNLKVKNVKK